MHPLRVVLGAVGAIATLFGVGLTVAPGVFRTGPVEQLTASIAETNPMTLLVVLGVAAGLLIAVAAWPRTTSTGPTDAERRFATAVQTAAGGDRAGPETDLLGADLDTAARRGGEHWEGVRSELAETAVRTYARTADVPPEAARAAIEDGGWTDDSLAAGVVTGETPPVARLRLWLAPERERRRRLERTVAAIEQTRRFQQGQR